MVIPKKLQNKKESSFFNQLYVKLEQNTLKTQNNIFHLLKSNVSKKPTKVRFIFAKN